MIQRFCLVLLAIFSLAGLGVRPGAVQAGAVPLPSDPTAQDGWYGVPDLDRNSGRFLSVSGGLNFTLAADATSSTRNLMRLCFDPAQVTQVRIASYDPGTRGRWDQRVDGTYVLTQPDTSFRIYPDPDNTVGPALVAGNPAPVAPLLTLKALEASLANEDQTWCSLYDKAINDASHQAAKNATDGKYYFLVSTQLEAAPGQVLAGYEANAYKMAFNGTYAFPANAVIGVTCGVIDGLELIGPGSTLLVSNDPFPDILPLGQADDIVNSYDGTIEFEFDASGFCSDLQIQEADSDWNRALAAGEPSDPNPTGVPPDSGIPYINPQPPQGLRDASAFAITGQMLNVPTGPGKVLGNRTISAVGYQVLRPNGTTFTTDEYSLARDAAGNLVPWGKASITNQYMAGWTLPTPDPFAYMTVPFSELQANAGRWKLRAVGLDARNAIFFRWNQDFGTTPRTVKVTGLVWCDENADNEPGQAEPGLEGIEVEIILAGQLTGKKVTTGADGKFSVALLPGTYTIKVLSDVCFPAKFQQPFTFVVDACAEDFQVYLPYECEGEASGTVFCNNPATPGGFGAGDTPFDMASVVVLERLGAGNAVLEKLEVPVAANVGSWKATDLKPGSWRAFIKADPAIDVLTKTTTQPVLFTISRTICKATADFGYVCEVDLCGKLFCDKDGNCLLDPQLDDVLGGVTVVATLQGSVPLVTKQTLTDVNGEFCFKVPNGKWIITIDPNQPALAGTKLLSSPPNPIDVVGSAIRNLLYCYECFGRICGTVYLNKPDCDGDYDLVTDQPLPAITVNLWKSPAGPPALPFRQTATDAQGNYCFLDLEAGTYLVQVAGGQPALQTLFATQPVQRTPVLVRGGSVEDQDFGYCQKARILGKVFRENGRNDCDGIYQGDDTPIAGVTVSLVGTNPVRPPQLDVTDVNGDYDFPNLEPGTYAVSVDGGQPQLIVLAPGSALSVPVTLLPGDETRVDYPFCPSWICGTVYKNAPKDCDENYDLGVDTPLPGIVVNVWKSPAGPPALPFRTAVTGLDGGYCFKDLDAGTYRVQVGSGQPQLVNLTATQPVVRNPIVLPGTKVLQQDFGYCEPGKIRGRVFRDSGSKDCDGVYQGDDKPIAGVVVALVGTNPVRPPALAVTDANGLYEFPNLQPGQYSVSVDGSQPVLVVVAPGAALTVPATILGGDEVVIDFPFCPGQICGTVYKNEPKDCDENYDLGADTPLPGITVNLWKAPAGPPALPLRTTVTGLDGGYCFKDLDAGLYRVQVGNGQPQLVGLVATQPVVRNPVLLAGGKVLNQDFGYCELGLIRGRVFRDSGSNDCDGIYQGDDTPIAGVLVSLVGTNPVRPPAVDVTDANGFYEFTNLQPGQWQVQVDGNQPVLVVVAPGGATTVPATILGGDEVVIDFPFCPGQICGTVYKNDPEDCDEDYDLGADLPLPGITVVLWKAPAGPPAPALRTTVTAADGGYCFKDLDAGLYRVQVGGGQPQLVNLTPTQPVVRNPVVLAGGKVLNQDFGYCEPLGRIYGYVFENPTCTCDDTFDAGDEPKAGVGVTLQRTVEDMVFLLETVTDANGFYEFTNLPAGNYTVVVDGASPVLVDLTPSTPVSVGPFFLPSGGEARVDFGYCSQRVCGIVFREPPCECDGVYNQGDLPAVGVLVQLIGLDGPQAGVVREMLTDASGSYCFERLPAGRYEVSIPDGQAPLADLNPSTDTVLTVTVGPGRCRLDANFGWCPPGEQKICAKVFCEPKGECDGVFDEGRDTWMPWIEVFVAENPSDTYVRSGFTDENGRICFDDLPQGSYVIYVGANQGRLADYKPSTPDCLPVVIEECGQQEFCFGYCQDCKPTPCCEGDLREVLVGTSFWVGECTNKFDIKARLLNGCSSTSCEIDSACRSWCGTWRGSELGANEVLEIVDVRVSCGVAWVVIRIKAQGAWFQDGVFGRDGYSLRVTLNGVSYKGCATLRCESFRPGQYFDLCCDDRDVPSCDCPWRWDGRSTWDSPWLCNPKKVCARYIVLDTVSQDAWACSNLGTPALAHN